MSDADKMDEADVRRAIAALNRMMETEFAGIVRYTRYSLMVSGYNRLPIAA